jgi:PAT family beta-lactamase induction signal transducer AmpG
MTYWLAKVGIDKKTIGFAIGLTTPYTLKFLWAPLIDRLRLPVLAGLFGQRRAWLFFVQVLLVAAIWRLGASDPAHHLGIFAFWAIVTAFLSATQDIVIDAYRIEILSPAELPYGTAMNQFGYRFGNLLAGAGTVWLASNEGFGGGWAMAYAMTALLVLPAAIAALLIGPGMHDAVVKRVRERGWFRSTVIAPFREFLSRRGALLILLFVLIYKLGDAMGQSMLNPMIVDLHFTDREYIAVSKFIGFGSLMAGIALSALVISRLGMGRALFVTGVLMMLTNLLFSLLAVIGHSTLMLALAVGTENFLSGLALTAFATYLSGLSNLAYTATQYALLSSFAAVGRTFLATPAGIIADRLGWPLFYVFTTLAALPGLLLLWVMWRRGFVGESVRTAG